MSGASDTLDPIGAAQDDINRSKHLIASTLDDLTQHHSWLESYHRDERRRAERLRRQEALRRLELRRQRAAWILRRFTMTALAVMRSTANFSVNFLLAARIFTRRAAAWTAPRARMLAVVLLGSLSTGLSWSRHTALFLAQTGFAGASIGLAWTVRTSDILGVAFREHLSAGSALLWAKVAVLARPMRKRASTAWVRTRFRSRRFAAMVQTRLQRALTTGASLARTQSRGLALSVSRSALAGWSRAKMQASRVLKTSDSRHRALVVRRCTALVSAEPWRARLPVVRGS